MAEFDEDEVLAAARFFAACYMAMRKAPARAPRVQPCLDPAEQAPASIRTTAPTEDSGASPSSEPTDDGFVNRFLTKPPLIAASGKSKRD